MLCLCACVRPEACTVQIQSACEHTQVCVSCTPNPPFVRQDEDVATMKRDSRKTVKAMRKATLLGTSLAPKHCPRGLEHLASPEELARRCRLREDLTKAVLEEQSLQRREGISRPHALARVSSVLSKWTRDDSHQAAMNDATVAGSIYAGDVENDRRPAAAPAPSALLPCVDDAEATTDAASSSTSTSHSKTASRLVGHRHRQVVVVVSPRRIRQPTILLQVPKPIKPTLVLP